MKLIVVATLYIIGIFVFAFWVIGKNGFNEIIEQEINKNPNVTILPEGVIRFCFFVATVIVSMLWPVIIVLVPIKALKNLLK